MAANDLNVSIGAEISGLDKGLEQAGKSLSKFETKVKNLAKVGDQMKSIGKKLSIGLTVPLTALGGLAVKTFADFSQEMAKVKAISGATAEEFDSLRKSAQDLGSSTRYSATEVAALQLNLSKLGFDPKAITDSTEAILNLALATGEDLAQSATVAAGVMNAFGIETSDAGRVADVMAKSFSGSALDLNKFSIAMGNVGSEANIAGESLESTTAFLGVLIDQGVPASRAATGLKVIFQELATSGMTMTEAFEQINESTNKSATAQELFGRTAGGTAVVLAENAEKADELTQSFLNSGGAATEMAAIMDNTLTGSMMSLKSASEGAMIAIGEILAPAIQKLAGFLTNAISKFRDLSPAMQKGIVIFGGIAAAIGPVIGALGLVASSIPFVVAGLGSIGGALAVLTGPIGLVVLGLGAIVFAVTKNWDKIKPYILNTINWFTELYNESMVIRYAVEAIGLQFKNSFALIKGVLNTSWEVIKSFAKGVADIFGGIGTAIKGVFTGDWDMIKDGSRNITKAFQTSFVNIKDDVIDGAKSTFNDINDNINKALENTLRGKRDIITDIFESEPGSVEKVKQDKEKEIQDIVNSINGSVGRAKITPISGAIIEGQGVQLTEQNEEIKIALDKNVQTLTDYEMRVKELGLKINEAWGAITADTLASSISGSMEAIGEALATGGNVFAAFGNSLIQSFAGFLSDIGDMLIKYGTLGVAKGKLDIAIAAGGPLAIGAGIAAIAVGAALKIAGAAIGSASQGGFGGSSPSGAGGGGQRMPATSGGASQGFGGGTVVFKISGQDLVGVLSRTLDRNSRLGGDLNLA